MPIEHHLSQVSTLHKVSSGGCLVFTVYRPGDPGVRQCLVVTNAWQCLVVSRGQAPLAAHLILTQAPASQPPP